MYFMFCLKCTRFAPRDYTLDISTFFFSIFKFLAKCPPIFKKGIILHIKKSVRCCTYHTILIYHHQSLIIFGHNTKKKKIVDIFLTKNSFSKIIINSWMGFQCGVRASINSISSPGAEWNAGQSGTHRKVFTN